MKQWEKLTGAKHNLTSFVEVGAGQSAIACDFSFVGVTPPQAY